MNKEAYLKGYTSKKSYGLDAYKSYIGQIGKEAALKSTKSNRPAFYRKDKPELS